MKRFLKRLLSLLCAVCMLTSGLGGLDGVFARKTPVVLTQELKASDGSRYEVTVTYEIELEEDEEPPAEPLLVVRELLAPEEKEEPEAAEAAAEPEASAEPAEADAPVDPPAEPETDAEPAEADALVDPLSEPETDAEPAEADALVAPLSEPETDAEPAEADALVDPLSAEPETDAEPAPEAEPDDAAELEEGFDYTYDEYVEKAARALEYKVWELASARVFDISLLDPVTGEELQPESSVKVSIRLLEDSFGEENPVGVVHFGEDEPEVMASAVTDESDAVEFETEGFSVYVVIEHEGRQIVTEPRVEFHFIDELYHDNSELDYASLAAGVYQAPPYRFPNKANLLQTTQILKSGEILELVKNPDNITVDEYVKTTDTVIDPAHTYYTYNPATMSYTVVDTPDVSQIGSYYECVPADKYFFGWYLVSGSINTNANLGSLDDIVYTWSDDPQQISFEDALSITAGTDANDPLQVGDKIKWSVGGLSGEAKLDVEGTAHVFLAPVFEDYYFINFHLGSRTDSDLRTSILARKLVVLGSDGKVTAHIGGVEAPSTNVVRFVFSGWETIYENYTTKTEYITVDAETGNEIDNSATVVGATETGFNAVFTESDFNSDKDVDLYPIFSEARWIYFDTGKSGNGASYVGARYRITNDHNTGTYYETLPVSSRPGYEFDGWYADAVADDEGNITNLTDAVSVEIKYIDDTGAAQSVTENRVAHKLVNADGTLADTNFEDAVAGYTRYRVVDGKLYLYEGLERLTLYAKWKANTVPYTVIYWLENANDDDYTLMYYKTMQGVAGQMTAAAATQPTDTVERDNDGVMETYTPYTEYKLRFAHLSTDQDKSRDGEQSGIQQRPIAGDGSTIVNVYYDRNVYTLRFDIGFSRRTSTSGTTTDYPAMTASEAAAYSGTVYGIVDGARIALTPDGNGGWLYDGGDTNVGYGLVGGKYVPLTPGEVTTEQLYKPYVFTQTTANGEDLYGVSGSEYVKLNATSSESTDHQDVTVYQRTNALTAGKDYLIVSVGAAGDGYALGHSGATIARDDVTVNAANSNGVASDAAYILSSDVDPTSVWSVTTGYKFQNGGYYLRRSNGNALQISTTNSNNSWGWDGTNNRLSINSRYLRYYNNTFSLNTASNSVFLYEKTTVQQEITTTAWSYTVEGTGAAYDDAQPRYARTEYSGADRYTAAQLTENGGTYYYADTTGKYGAAGMNVPMQAAETETAVHSWTYGGETYADTIYPFTPYTGTLYKQETLSGTHTYYVSTITNSDNYYDFPASSQSQVSQGSIPTDFISCGRYTSGDYTIYYYDLTAKYGENILSRYPGSQPGRPSVRFVGWIPQQDSYFWATEKTSIKGYFETMSETLILTGTAYTNYNAGKRTVDPDTCVAVTAENGVAQEFRCRYQANTNNYLYRIYLADPETGAYPSEPTDKIIITAGTGSYPDMQTAPSYEGYGDGNGDNGPAESYELSSDGTKSARSHNYSGAYAIPELTAAGIASGIIVEFYFLPNEHTLTFKYADSSVIGSSTYNYGQSLAGADTSFTETVEANKPEGHVFSGWYENKDGVGNPFNFNTAMPDGNIILYAIYKPVRYTVRIDPDGGEIDHVSHDYDNNSAVDNGKAYFNYWYNSSGVVVQRRERSGVVTWRSYDPETGLWNNITDPNDFGVTPLATFNRGVIYKKDANGDLILDDLGNPIVEREADAGYRDDQSTYFNGTYGVKVEEYKNVKRNYIPLSDAAAADYAASGGTVYYYVNTQMLPSDGSPGLPSDLRNALYMTEEELHQYYLFYRDWITGNLQGHYITGTTLYGEEAWKNIYVSEQKYRMAFPGEHYEFLGWYEVQYDSEGNETGLSDMPYNFDDPVTGPFTLRAVWRLDAGYQILYNPEYTMPSGVVINGNLWMNTWTDPAPGSKYAAGATTHILQQPTGLTADGSPTNDYIFYGWQVVSRDGTPLSDKILDPGSPYTISAADADTNGIIRIRAVYEETDFSHRKPYVTNLALDANGGFVTGGTYYNGDSLVKGVELADGDDRALEWNGFGSVVVNAGGDSVDFATIQTEKAVHLYEYATELTEDENGSALDPIGRNYFTHPDGHFLLGFDEGASEGDYIATYPADGVIAVTRNDDHTVYAVWEPLVYLNLYNRTAYTDGGVDYPGGDVTFTISSTSGDTLYVVNEKLGLYDRAPCSVTNITLAPGESLHLAVPQGKDHDITIEGVNTISGYKLFENSYKHFEQSDQTLRQVGHLKGDASQPGTGYGKTYTLTDYLFVDESGLDVVFTAVKQDFTLILTDPKNGTGTEEVYFTYDQLSDPATNNYPLTETRAYIGWIFKGWDEDPNATTPTYPVGGSGITDLQAFFHVGQTGETDEVTLYAIWEVNAEATIVDVWKDVPLPGDPDKEFSFLVSIYGRITKTGEPTFEQSRGLSVWLKDDQFIRIKSDQHEGDAATGDLAYLEVTIQKYDRDLDHPVGAPQNYRLDATYGSGTISGYSVQVTETVDPNYTPTVTLVASADQANFPITVADTPVASWTNANAGGTVVFHNTRKVADVTVSKAFTDPVDAAPSASFTVTVTAPSDSRYTLPAGDAAFSLGNGGVKIIKDVPVGATVTVKETEDVRYETTATLTKTDGGAAIADSDGSVCGMSFTLPEGGAAAAFTNVRKSYPVRIVKVGWDGASELTNVESRFSLNRGATLLVNGKYTTPTDNVVFDGMLYTADYTLTEMWVQSGYRGLKAPVTLQIIGDDTVTVPGYTTRGDGSLVDPTGQIVISGNKTSGFLVKVFNVKTVDVTVSKELIDPLIETTRTFHFALSYGYSLNGVSSGESLSGETAIPIVSGGSSVVTVPVGATGLTVSEETNRTFSGNTVAEIYDTYYKVTNGAVTRVDSTSGSAYTFTGAVTAADNGDVITFTNNAKTVDITVKKIVDADDKSGSFAFTATLLHGAAPIRNYPIYSNGTPEDIDNYDRTATDGTYSFSLSDNGTIALTVPIGARLLVRETGVSGTTDPSVTLSDYATEAAVAPTGSGIYNSSNNSFNDDPTSPAWLTFTLATVPGIPLTLTYTNGSGGKPVLFMKRDGFGTPISGATFTLYTDSGCTAVFQKKGAAVTATAADGSANFKDASDATLPLGTVYFEKVPAGVYYMKETVSPGSAYRFNASDTPIYRVVVGAAGSMVETYQLPTGKEFLITRLDELDLNVETYGVLNISVSERRVILRKIDENMEPLPGATFDLLRWDMTKVQTCTSGTVDGAGCIFSGALPLGTYYLHETVAPTGYNSGSWYVVKIAASGETVTRFATQTEAESYAATLNANS